MSPKGYLLQDNASKFGTLLLLSSGQHEINPSNGLCIQASRTTLSLTIKPIEVAAKPTTAAAISVNNDGSHASPASNSYRALFTCNREGENNSENVSGDEIQKNPLPEIASKKTPAKFISKAHNDAEEDDS